MNFKFDIAEAVKTVFFGIFASTKSKFTIDDFIAKNHHEIGFRDYFNNSFKNQVLQVEKLRLYNLKIIKIATIFVLAMLGALYYKQKIKHNFFGFSFVIFCILVFLANHLNQGFVKIYRQIFTQNFFNFFGENIIYKKDGANLFKRYQDFFALPNFNSTISKSSNLVSGKIKNNFFNLQEVELFDKNIIQKKNRKFKESDKAQMHKNGIAEFVEIEKITKIARGLVIIIDLQKKFTSRTVFKKTGFRITNDNNPDPQNLEKILTNYHDFEKKFKTYSNYAVEVNHDLTASFVEKFMEVADLFKNDFMSASFCENSFLIYFETSHRLFEPSQLYQQLNLVLESKKIISALSIIFESADTFENNSSPS